MIIACSYTTVMMAARGSSEPETIQCGLKLSGVCNCCKSLQQLEKYIIDQATVGKFFKQAANHKVFLSKHNRHETWR
jgi:hypothetical protein